MFDRDLSYLLCLEESSQDDLERKKLYAPKSKRRIVLKNGETVINRLASFNNYFINCDLLDKDENLFNGKPSTLLECFDVIGEPFKRVRYSKTNPAVKKLLSDVLTSIRITVTDENSEMIDFNGLPLYFELEIMRI